MVGDDVDSAGDEEEEDDFDFYRLQQDDHPDLPYFQQKMPANPSLGELEHKESASSSEGKHSAEGEEEDSDADLDSEEGDVAELVDTSSGSDAELEPLL